MAGIDQSTLFAITQVRSVFGDDIGNTPRVGLGTGFFLRTSSDAVVFVTNRHNVDPTLNPAARAMGSTARLTGLALLLRRYEGAQPMRETSFLPMLT